MKSIPYYEKNEVKYPDEITTPSDHFGLLVELI